MKILFRTHNPFKWMVVLAGLAILFSSSRAAFASPGLNLQTQKSTPGQTLSGVWSSVPSGTINELTSVAFSSPSSGWAGGTNVLLRYGGTSWQVFSVPALGTDFVVLSISMVSDTNGWLVGRAKIANPYYDAVILKWDGTQWNPVVLPATPFGLGFGTVSAVDDNNVYAANGSTLCNPACNDLIGWAYHRDGSSWISTDIGAHRRVYDLAMNGNNDGWMVGDEKDTSTNQYLSLIMRWVNGNWERVTPPTMNSNWLDAVSVLDADHAMAVGGYATIMWNGSAWSLVPLNWTSSPQLLKDVQIMSANDAWIVGEMGTIIHWDGTSLTLVSSPVTTSLYGVAKSSPSELWAVGASGTILHYKAASLTVDNASGAAGSYFNLNGQNFPPNQTAAISVNGHVLQPAAISVNENLLQTVSTDAQGNLIVTLSTSGVEQGTYIIQAVVGSLVGTADFHIDNGDPMWPQVGSYPTVAVPTGIGFAYSAYLPVIIR